MDQKKIDEILDDFDGSHETFRLYKDRLVLVLQEILNKSEIPTDSISGSLMTRGDLRSSLSQDIVSYNSFSEVEGVVSIRVVLMFHDDIALTAELLKREFFIEPLQLSHNESLEQDRFGVSINKFFLMVSEEKSGQMEYARFSSLKIVLTIRSTFQDAWFGVKEKFVQMARSGLIGEGNMNQLAQVSYLIKMADAELSRIRFSLDEKNQKRQVQAPPKEVVHIRTEKQGNKVKENTVQNKEVSHFNDGKPEFSEVTMRTFRDNLERFILDDQTIRNIDRNISDYYDTALTYNDEFVDTLARMYSNARIIKTDSIKEALDNGEPLVREMMKHLYDDIYQKRSEYIHKGTCLLVMFFILLAKTGSVDIIRRHVGGHLERTGISDTEFANNILLYYKKSAGTLKDGT
ncbi:MAG: hypothetical protein HQL07_03655 [Nitrospirae bacterium]|nr:hypothetical protein [Magnetococcales bacterium]HAT50971.1 hypothetical protein [Alphaproteobacteria bacterium]